MKKGDFAFLLERSILTILRDTIIRNLILLTVALVKGFKCQINPEVMKLL